MDEQKICRVKQDTTRTDLYSSLHDWSNSERIGENVSLCQKKEAKNSSFVRFVSFTILLRNDREQSISNVNNLKKKAKHCLLFFLSRLQSDR